MAAIRRIRQDLHVRAYNAAGAGNQHDLLACVDELKLLDPAGLCALNLWWQPLRERRWILSNAAFGGDVPCISLLVDLVKERPADWHTQVREGDHRGGARWLRKGSGGLNNPFTQAILGQGTLAGAQGAASRGDREACVCGALEALRPLLALLNESQAQAVFHVDATDCIISYRGGGITCLDYVIITEADTTDDAPMTRLLWERTDGQRLRNTQAVWLRKLRQLPALKPLLLAAAFVWAPTTQSQQHCILQRHLRRQYGSKRQPQKWRRRRNQLWQRTKQPNRGPEQSPSAATSPPAASVAEPDPKSVTLEVVRRQQDDAVAAVAEAAAAAERPAAQKQKQAAAVLNTTTVKPETTAAGTATNTAGTDTSRGSCGGGDGGAAPFDVGGWVAAALRVPPERPAARALAAALCRAGFTTPVQCAVLTPAVLASLRGGDGARVTWGIPARLVAEAAERLCSEGPVAAAAAAAAAVKLPPQAPLAAAAAAAAATQSHWELAHALDPGMTEAESTRIAEALWALLGGHVEEAHWLALATPGDFAEAGLGCVADRLLVCAAFGGCSEVAPAERPPAPAKRARLS
ncbi:hypothetical protein JKP88DRAFT_251572 [Tribonema minus]|uniref:Uncharacterized protein n=1 Tax=Tribonema minus TaxID=303371 RepID=A0A835ZMG7_9STRA|nr:hypothetical protein JKP88DRAFT_251572 [Tribonema minus]